MRFLLIEDDRETAHHIAKILQDEGYTVDQATNGYDGLAKSLAAQYDVIIVDRMLPGLDGLSVVKKLRTHGNQTPVLFLTTMDGLDDRVEGLKGGADDYLAKPFAASELLARIIAISRRTSGEFARLIARDLEIDLARRTVQRAGQTIILQPQEFRLLEFLMRHSGRVVTRNMLLEKVWDISFDPRTNIVETHMSHLRAKVDRGHDIELIHTVRGAGYIIRPD